MYEHEGEQQREAILASLTNDVRTRMTQVYGERITRESHETQDILPGIPNRDMDVDLAVRIRQLLATLHDEGFWNDERDQRAKTEQSIARNAIVFGESEPEQETELLFSGNDKYGLVYGLRGFPSEHISEEQLAREGDRMYLGWYVELFNRYIQERPQEMYPIAQQIAKAGLPLEPWIQTWMRRYEAQK